MYIKDNLIINIFIDINIIWLIFIIIKIGFMISPLLHIFIIIENLNFDSIYLKRNLIFFIFKLN